ncbi:putative Isoamyl alcohol oxidase [Seiridium cardinale]
MASIASFLLRLYFLISAQPSFAMDDRIEILNATLQGILQQAKPVSLPCFSSYNGKPSIVDEAACAAVRGNYTTNAYRVEIPAAFMNMQNEMCLSHPSDQCLLDTTVAPPGLPAANTTCSQGSVPDYYAEVTSSQEIIDSFVWANAYGFPLSVKNSGHDYMTRASANALDGFASIELWVHNLKGFDYCDDFVPEGCYPSVGRAITVGAGESTGDAYIFADEHNATILGGYSPTIALSGGWVQGGGHSSLSPVYGLGADRVVQFRVVTPDGVLRVANACQNSDLFRALRGGGGGTFGIVLEATHRVEPKMPIAVASITIPSNSTDDTIKKWIQRQTMDSYDWGRQGWGGHVAGLYLKHFNPLPQYANVSDGGAAAQATMQKATDFALANGGTSVVEVVPDWLTAWNKYVVPGALNSAGAGRFITSRLVPTDALSTEKGIAEILDFINSTFALGAAPKNFYVPVSTPFVADTDIGNPPTDSSELGTSVHTAWYSSIWSLSSGFSIAWNSTFEQRLQSFTNLTTITTNAEKLFPDSGSYVNEANPFTPDWKQAWWGDKYDFLLETEKKYDPNSTLRCWKCVGWDEPATPVIPGRTGPQYDFKCQSGLQDELDRVFS